MTTEESVSFSPGELTALKQIVSDWLHEEIAAPPFDPEITSVLKKLGIGSAQTAAAAAHEPKEASKLTPGPTSLA